MSKDSPAQYYHRTIMRAGVTCKKIPWQLSLQAAYC